ncbi:MAG: hypothetical protein Q8K32_31320 [Archangium sp.]|nr:hypothetical protein [Archangium sp.]
MSKTQPREHILQFFAYAHLPERLQAVSRPFGELAESIVVTVPRNPERTVALRKLLEAKDAAVRAVLAKAEVGSVVEAKAAPGQRMTVEVIEDDHALCVWFVTGDNTTVHRDTFAVSGLVVLPS